MANTTTWPTAHHGSGDFPKHANNLPRKLFWYPVEVVKSSGVLGLDATYQHLKRTRRRTPAGITIVADERYTDKVLKLLDMADCKAKATPMRRETSEEASSDSPLLETSDATMYRSAVGVLIYVSADKPDIQFTVKTLTTEMQAPTLRGLGRLKHLARYLHGTRDLGIFFAAGEATRRPLPVVLKSDADSDYAGDKLSRKSTSCGCLVADGCLLMNYSRGQRVVALSSGEAEFYAAVTAISESILIEHLLRFSGFKVLTALLTDSSAARGILRRQGVGRVRHLESATLWVQARVKDGLLKVGTVRGSANPADIGTKTLDAADLTKCLVKLNVFPCAVPKRAFSRVA